MLIKGSPIIITIIKIVNHIERNYYALTLPFQISYYNTCVCPQMELREHEHVVECVSWAPEAASAAINEAAGTDNRRANHAGPFLASGSRDKSVKVSAYTDIIPLVG